MTRLSVVVTIVDGGETLERCLTALARQTGIADLEVLVPFDSSVAGLDQMAARFPAVRFLALGRLVPETRVLSHREQHELFDRRRAAGLAAAQGDLVAILEDRGAPRPDWAARLVALHASLPYQVIGGAVENGNHSALAWAAFFCDFGRYEPPFAPGPRDYLTDINVCYKRSALEQTRALWRERYHETTVHWALTRAGVVLYLTPEPVVEQFRLGLRLGNLLRERVDWGRLFAHTRAVELGLGRRLLLALLCPVLPLVLFLRLAGDRLRRRRHLGALLRATPATLLLLIWWSVGEFQGYLTGRP